MQGVTTNPNYRGMFLDRKLTLEPIQEPQFDEYLPAIQAFLDKETARYPHPNNENYQNIASSRDDFLEISVLKMSGEIFGVSILQRRKCWPEWVARVLSRTFLSPELRYCGLVPKGVRARKEQSYSTQYFLRHQTITAREMGLKAVFFSMETMVRRNKMFNIVDWINLSVEDADFSVLPYLVYTCPSKKIIQQSSCWQNVALQILQPDVNNDVFRDSFPTMDLSTFNQVFGNPRMSDKLVNT